MDRYEFPSLELVSSSLRSSISHMARTTLSAIESAEGASSLMNVDLYLPMNTTVLALHLAFGNYASIVAFRIKATCPAPYADINILRHHLVVTELSAHTLANSQNPVHDTPFITVSVTQRGPNDPIEIPPYFFESLYRYEVDWLEKL